MENSFLKEVFMYKQITKEVLMVRPAAFHFNPDTVESNIYQKKDDTKPSIVQKKAEEEFDNVVSTLRKKGVKVNVINDYKEPKTTDCVFPNNWFSTHQDGKIVLYSMFSESRRLEIEKFSKEVIELFKSNKEDMEVELFDYSPKAKEGIFLEGTGSLCLDRVNKIAYCALSNRSNKELFLQFCKDTGYKPVHFNAYQDNTPIYHTNVLMGVGSKSVMICLDSISEADRDRVKEEITKSGRKIINISLSQVKSFLGNVIELQGKDTSLWCMSKTAYDSLENWQIEELKKDGEILYADIPTIEFYGGGSLRCMIAEIF